MIDAIERCMKHFPDWMRQGLKLFTHGMRPIATVVVAVIVVVSTVVVVVVIVVVAAVVVIIDII